MLLSGCSGLKTRQPDEDALPELEYTRPENEKIENRESQKTLKSQGTLSDDSDYILYANNELEISGDVLTSKLKSEKPLTEALKDVTVLTLNVKEIGEETCGDLSMIQSVNLGPDVTSIGDSAFSKCSALGTIQFPASVEAIGDYAFQGCTSLWSADIPSTVTSMGAYVFTGCDSLRAVKIDADVCESTFAECTALRDMMNNKTMPFLPLPPQIPSASQKQQALNRRFSGEQLPEPQNGSRELKEIVAKACAYAPEDRYHSALEMRNALEALSSSKQAWTKAILEELALPEDILHESNRPIAQRAAAEEKPPKSDIPPAKRKPIVPLVVCGILGICILAGGLLWLNRKHASPEPAAMTEALQEQTETAAEPEETTAPGSTTEETLPAATEAESTAAVLLSNVDCTYEIAEDGITITGISGQTPSEVILPEELENLPVTRIGNGAFQSNTSLKKVTLPSGILVIGEKAFSGCTRLQSISFPDGLTEISASAFENCSNLSSVLLPESVHAIGPWAFSNCKKLLSITIPGSASDLGEWAFSGCSSLSELTFSPGITTISNYLFYNCQGLKAVTIPDGVITIGIGAFSGCTALSEVTLPESMRTLSSEAFQGTALESISVPSACSLGSNAVPLGCKIYSTR